MKTREELSAIKTELDEARLAQVVGGKFDSPQIDEEEKKRRPAPPSDL